MLKMNHNSSVILSENELSDLINWAEEVNLIRGNVKNNEIIKSLFNKQFLKLTLKITVGFSFTTVGYFSLLIFFPYILQNYGNSNENNKEFIYIFAGLFEILGITISSVIIKKKILIIIIP